jgi:hypothetical protein
VVKDGSIERTMLFNALSSVIIFMKMELWQQKSWKHMLFRPS